jgi:hypothetical protein
MKMPAQRTNAESGQALITAIIFLLALTFMGFGLVAMSTVDVSSSRNLRLSSDAFDAAEQGAFLGMSYAGNNATLFVTGKNQGDTVRLKSTTNTTRTTYDPQQYDVLLTMGGKTEQPPGELKAGSKAGGRMAQFMFVTVKIESRGLVSETPTGISAMFDWTKRPMVTETIQMMVRVRKASW